MLMKSKSKDFISPFSPLSADIHVNQIGYLPKDIKCAIITHGGREFHLNRCDTDETVYTGTVFCKTNERDADSQDVCCYADFSDYHEPGNYYIESDGRKSVPFTIGQDVYSDVQRALLRGLFYNRCGCDLDEAHAGKYHHPACHCKPKTYCLRKSVETDESGTKILSMEHAEYLDVSGGWHEAGDFSKNIISGAIAAMFLMYGAEMFPDSFTDSSNIPESGNGTPDALNECRWELEFAMRLQRESGGFSHIVFPWVHPGVSLPDQDPSTYYVWQESVESTGDGVMLLAHAARTYRQYDPAFADRCLDSAKRGWEWLEKHPEGYPFGAVNTMPLGYGLIIGSRTETSNDKRFAAACEMYATTGEEKYMQVIRNLAFDQKEFSGFRKGVFTGFGVIAYLLYTPEEKQDKIITEILRSSFLWECKAAFDSYLKNGYNLSHTGSFGWASNYGITVNACKMIFAQMIDPSLDYHEAISGTFSYLLGTNAVDKCFVSGFGTHSFLHPHHRQSTYYGEAMPGYLAGGCVNYELILPRSKQISQYLKPDVPPLKSFADEEPFFMMTEIEVDWNTCPIFVCVYLRNKCR